MKKIYSNKTKQLLHIVKKFENITGRQELVPANNFLQVATIQASKDNKFKPHHHLWKENIFEQNIAQECWTILKGKVKVIYYDIDDTYLTEETLSFGDCTITLYGGHEYEILDDDTIIIETKTGPYLDRNLDKIYFERKK